MKVFVAGASGAIGRPTVRQLVAAVPFVHSEDAAAAVGAAIERGTPGVYNIVDDEPAPVEEWLPVFAEALGAKPPRRAPLWMARLAAGGLANTMVELRGASNAKAKRELRWQPAHPSWRHGFKRNFNDLSELTGKVP